MPDYGHDLTFGTFITPQNQRPQDVVALAQLTEAAGLELATFQDHPYQPAFLDTWTLLSWVAAQTQTLRVAANVLNLPLRPPAVLARSAASLDLLSGGRVELGLGAGAFWDAIEAMGGPRRTPGEAVDALSEAIDVIRGIWDPGRGGVRVRGEHYAVKGAKRGPEPAHDIEIWLGAYKPRMLRLTGRKADGWVPSLSYLEQQDIASANRAIDEAALAAGRDPREVRRLLNIQSADFDRLFELATEHGFSTFILATDDPETIQRFGQEVAPALREAVAAAREQAGHAEGARARHTSARPAPRRHRLRRRARRPGRRRARRPRLRQGPLDLHPHRHTRARPAPRRRGRGRRGARLRPRAGRRTGGAQRRARDQRPLDQRRRHRHRPRQAQRRHHARCHRRVRVGPGARWGEVAQTLSPFGLGMSSGDYGDVGVGGLATAGGIGFLGRKHGLTLDHVTAAEVVLADGRHVRADRDQHPDLFWAVRGAGGNFGIVTALELDAYPVGDVVFSRMVFAADAGLLERWGALVEAAPRELTSFLTMVSARARHRPALHGLRRRRGPGGRGADAAPGRRPRARPGGVPGPLPRGRGAAGRPAHRLEPAARRAPGLVDHVTPALAEALVDLLPSAPFLQLRAVGGAINDVDPAATAYAHRHQNFAVNAVSSSLERVNPPWDETIAPHTSGLYLSFNTDPRPERLAEAFPGPTLDRLRSLKAIYDPENVFNQNTPIEAVTPSPA